MTREQKILLGVVIGVFIVGLAMLLGYMTTGFQQENVARVTVEPKGSGPAADSQEDSNTVQPIRNSEFTAQAPSKQMPTLMEFGADWCKFCQQMKPVIADVKNKYKDKVKVITVDVDKDKQAAKKYKIAAIPTQIFFDTKGKQVFRHEGVYTKTEVEAQLKKMGVKT